MMLDVSSGLLQVERGKLVADSDALVEGFVGGETELVAEIGLAKEHQRDRGDRVRPLIEEKVELTKKLARYQVGLINDEKHLEAKRLWRLLRACRSYVPQRISASVARQSR
jgi:hypothetical protein